MKSRQSPFQVHWNRQISPQQYASPEKQQTVSNRERRVFATGHSAPGKCIHRKKRRRPEAVTRMGNMQTAQWQGPADALGQPVWMISQSLPEVERQWQQGIEQRERQPAHNEDLLRMPETQYVRKPRRETGRARPGQPLDEEVRCEPGQGVGGPSTNLIDENGAWRARFTSPTR